MRGDVTLQVQCLMPEKLIDRATAAGARFCSVSPHGRNGLVVRCDATSARQLLALCERYSLPAHVVRRRGASAAARFIRHRATLAAGIACAALLCALFLSRLWIVDIAFTGENAARGDPAAVSRALKVLGIAPGSSRHIDTGLLAQQLQAGDSRYSYVGARVQGVRLLVEIVPESPAPALYDLNAPRDLVCERDGVVVRAVVRSGEACVKPGDAVRRGQLLIRGEEQSARDATRPIAALGEVIVRTWVTGEAGLSRVQPAITETGRRSNGARLTVLGMEWPILPSEDYPSQRIRREYLPIGGLFLPLEIERSTHIETRCETIEIPRVALMARARAMALADARMALCRTDPGTYTVERSWVDYSDRNGTLIARAVLEIQTDAATTREALQGG